MVPDTPEPQIHPVGSCGLRQEPAGPPNGRGVAWTAEEMPPTTEWCDEQSSLLELLGNPLPEARDGRIGRANRWKATARVSDSPSAIPGLELLHHREVDFQDSGAGVRRTCVVRHV